MIPGYFGVDMWGFFWVCLVVVVCLFVVDFFVCFFVFLWGFSCLGIS